MKLSGPTCGEMLSEDEKSHPRDVKPARAGWVRLERKVRRALTLEPTRARETPVNGCAHVMPMEWEWKFIPPSPKGKDLKRIAPREERGKAGMDEKPDHLEGLKELEP